MIRKSGKPIVFINFKYVRLIRVTVCFSGKLKINMHDILIQKSCRFFCIFVTNVTYKKYVIVFYYNLRVLNSYKIMEYYVFLHCNSFYYTHMIIYNAYHLLA